VTETKQRIPRNAVIALAVAGVLLVLIAGYFVLIGPQRSKLASTKKEIADVQKQIDDLRQTTADRKKQPKIRYARLYELTKAMPNSNDFPDVMLALVATARESGITLTAIGAQPVVNLPSYQALPIRLEFAANYYQLSDFLFRLRNFVRVRHGELEASGRLYAIDNIDVGRPPLGYRYPVVSVSMQVRAFVYGSGVAAAAGAPSSTDTTSTSTGSTDTTSTTTTPSGDTGATSTTPAGDTSTTSSALGVSP
jgi:hypothetical protein